LWFVSQGLLFFESENLENLRTPLLGISMGMEAARAVAGYIGQSHEPGNELSRLRLLCSVCFSALLRLSALDEGFSLVLSFVAGRC
jgi:hypothetical protein